MVENKQGIKATVAVVSMVFLCACYGSIGGEGDGDAADAADQADPDISQDETSDTQPDYAPPPPMPRVVDILAVVDNSSTMADEQEALIMAVPTLVEALMDPAVDPATGEPVRDPFLSLHMGVVSTNLGGGGYIVEGCDGNGDDGVLLHAPRGAGCDEVFPKFLSLQAEEGIPPASGEMSSLLQDFACIASLGTSGCGFEQPLESAYRALVVNARPGEVNTGFLREDSLLVILFITDEDDCSVEDNSLFNLEGLDYAVNLRCFMEKDMLFPVSRYVEAFRGLRRHPDLVVVGMAVGVPDVGACTGSGDSVSTCLARDDMDEVVRPDGRLLEYTCTYPSDCTPPDPPYSGDCSTAAFPARRFVELAQGLGAGAVIHSACTDSYRDMIDDVIIRITDLMR
jgi:hypothetical protein